MDEVCEYCEEEFEDCTCCGECGEPDVDWCSCRDHEEEEDE